MPLPITASGSSTFENDLAAVIAQNGMNGDAIEEAVRGSDFADIKPALVKALEHAWLTYDQFLASASSVRNLMIFMDDLPTRYVTSVMRSAKHREPQQAWEQNDFIDVVALPVAAVYCDVVVTEKQWAHRLRQGKIDQRYNTVLLNDAADLVEVLVHASVA